MSFLIYIILICIILFFVSKILNKFKFPKVGSLAVVTGAVKSGKTAFSVGLALSCYRRVHRKWKVKCFFIKLFKRKSKRVLPEEPLLYSNIPVVVKNGYCKLTLEHLLRKKRFNFKSVVLVDEASLVADSQLIQYKVVNTQLLLFFKLFGHETHGGLCVFNSQSITDLHYSLKRCTSQYFYIHHMSKYIPFVSMCHLREEVYSDDKGSLNVYTGDVEDSLKRVLMRKSVFKFYDYCAFSTFTDNLETLNERVNKTKFDNLKVKELVSFRPDFQEYSKKFIKEEKENA